MPVQRGGVRCFDIPLSWMTDKTLSADNYRRQPLLAALPLSSFVTALAMSCGLQPNKFIHGKVVN